MQSSRSGECIKHIERKAIAAVNIRAEVTTRADYVISTPGQVLFVCKNQTQKKMSQTLWYAVLERHWNT